jgi:hypothetical protein
MTGPSTFAAIADRANDLDRPAWSRLGFIGRMPVLTTLC